jgi:hypothetical protein
VWWCVHCGGCGAADDARVVVPQRAFPAVFEIVLADLEDDLAGLELREEGVDPGDAGCDEGEVECHTDGNS